MTTYEYPTCSIRDLKGAPLSVLVVLCIAHQPVRQAYLQLATGYSDKTVARALAYLQEVGLAERTRQGWQVANHAQLLPLGLSLDGDVLPGGQPTSFPQYGVSPAVDPQYVVSPAPTTVSWVCPPLEYGDPAPVCAQEAGYPALDAGCTGSPGCVYGEAASLSPQAGGAEEPGAEPEVSPPGEDGISPHPAAQHGVSPSPGRVINSLINPPPDSPPPSEEELLINGHGPDESEDDPTDEDLEDIWEALLEAGVMRNARTEALVRLPHLSADYIRAHHARLVRMGKGHETGLLIYILESNQPSPDFRPNHRAPKRYRSWNE